MCVSIAPAVTILPSPAITSVPRPPPDRDPLHACVSGFPALPIFTIRPSRIPMSALTMPQVIDDQRVGDHQVERAMLGFASGRGALAHAVANHLAAAEGDLVAIDGVIALYFDDQFGVGKPNAVAGGRARKDRRTCGGEFARSRSRLPISRVPLTRPLWPYTRSCAAERHQRDFFLFARFKSNRSAGGNIQPHAIGRFAIEYQRRC